MPLLEVIPLGNEWEELDSAFPEFDSKILFLEFVHYSVNDVSITQPNDVKKDVTTGLK